ncbi:MAG: ABC transporter permease [Spirochaetes bacterium]|nr:ABC transporter permease [Spirochaetota bacterium]
MMKYVFKRIILVIPTFLVITMITYAIIRLAPGDFVTMKAGLHGELTRGALGKQFLEEERKLYGLDKPIIVGYFDWLWKFIRLDLGTSREDGRPVATRIAEALPVTLLLNIITILITYMISIPLGIINSIKPGGLFDRATSLILFILYSLPHFWVALLLLMFFSSSEYLNIFPLDGIISDWVEEADFLTKLADVAWHLVLPVITLTYGSFAFLSRYARANMLEVINQQYIIAARSKGLTFNRVVFLHAFRNSLVPLVTLMASLLPALLGGSVIVEKIFSIPGLGRLAFDAIFSRDIPVIMAITSFSAILTLGGIFIADLLYGVVDPRIRLEAKL